MLTDVAYGLSCAEHKSACGAGGARATGGARRAPPRRSKGALVEALTQETARTRCFPGIAFRGDDARRRAWVIGSGLDIWEILQTPEDFALPEALLANSQVSPRHLRLALAYSNAHPEEIGEAIADNCRPLIELKVLYPFVETASS